MTDINLNSNLNEGGSQSVGLDDSGNDNGGGDVDCVKDDDENSMPMQVQTLIGKEANENGKEEAMNLALVSENDNENDNDSGNENNHEMMNGLNDLSDMKDTKDTKGVKGVNGLNNGMHEINGDKGETLISAGTLNGRSHDNNIDDIGNGKDNADDNANVDNDDDGSQLAMTAQNGNDGESRGGSHSGVNSNSNSDERGDDGNSEHEQSNLILQEEKEQEEQQQQQQEKCDADANDDDDDDADSLQAVTTKPLNEKDKDEHEHNDKHNDDTTKLSSLTLEEQIKTLTRERDAATQVSTELLARLAQSANDRESEELAIVHDLQNTLRDQMTQRAEYEHQTKTLQKTIDSYRQKLSEYSHMEDEMELLRTNVTQIMASKTSLEQEVVSLRSWREEYEHNMSILSNRLNEAKKKEANKSSAASRLEADNTSLNETISSLTTQLAASNKAKEKVESTMEKLKKKCIERIQLTEGALLEEQNLNEERKKKMKHFVEQKAEELRSAKCTNDELRSDLHKTSEALNHVRTKLHHMTEMYNSTSNKNRELVREITRIKKNTEQLHNLGSNLELELHKSAQETEEHKQKRNTAKHELMTMLRKLEAEQGVSEKLRDSIKFTFTPKALSQQQLLSESLDDFERELLKLSRRLGKTLPARIHSVSHDSTGTDGGTGGADGNGQGQEGVSTGTGTAVSGGSTSDSNGTKVKKNAKANSRSEWDTTRLLSNLEHETQLVSKEIMALNSSVERLHMLLDDSGEKNCVSTLNELFSAMASNGAPSVPGVLNGGNSRGQENNIRSTTSTFTKVVTDEDDAFL